MAPRAGGAGKGPRETFLGRLYATRGTSMAKKEDPNATIQLDQVDVDLLVSSESAPVQAPSPASVHPRRTTPPPLPPSSFAPPAASSPPPASTARPSHIQIGRAQ